MKSSSCIIVAMALAILCFTAVASAEWRIDIESKTVDAGATGVTVDFTGYWEDNLLSFTIPVIVREIDSGAFWTGELPYDTSGTGFYHPYQHGVAWSWPSPWAALLEEMRPGFRVAESFKCDPRRDSLYNGESPDHFVLLASGSGVPPLAPMPNGHKYCTITFDVTDVGGRFEFDTSCFTSAIPSIFMVDNQDPVVDHGPTGTGEAVFNKGVITIWKDNDQDGVPDHLDNCPFVWNDDQEDADIDSVGDACDNCEVNYNPLQENNDTDVYGDSCDNCPFVENIEQRDSDEDGIGDSCDVCPNDPDPTHQAPEDCDTTGILEIEDAVPAAYALSQNYPNPFNANTLIEFVLYQGGHARLEVYDILGQKVATIVDGYLPQGVHQAVWRGKDDQGKSVSSGVYFYRLTAGEFNEMKKMVLMK